MTPDSPIRSIVERELGAAFRLGELRVAGDGWCSFDGWELGSSVALSLRVRPRASLTEEWEERFALVQQRIAELDHPHLLRSRSYGFTGQLVWVVTDRVEGTSLADALDRVQVLDLRSCLRVVEQVASVLDYVHRRELGHGALCPADIVVTDSGWVMVSGFGATDQLGERDRVALADQRALAAIVWHCLAGRPWDDAGAVTGAALPGRLGAALERVLADPALAPARHATVLEFVSTLGAAEPDPERTALPVEEDESFAERRPIPWRRWIGPVSAAALVLVALVGTISAVRGRVESASAAITPAAVPPPAAYVPSPPAETAAIAVPPAAPPVRPVRQPDRAVRTVTARPAPPSAPSPPARLFVSSRPWGTLLLDGALVASTPVADLEVRPGPHVIRITRPGFRPHEETIRVKPGAEVRLIDLILTPATP